MKLIKNAIQLKCKIRVFPEKEKIFSLDMAMPVPCKNKTIASALAIAVPHGGYVSGFIKQAIFQFANNIFTKDLHNNEEFIAWFVQHWCEIS